MIPKKIHYCWFGRGEKSKLYKECIESWKKYYPDFEIIEWNEDNFDINCNHYVKEAYDNKKYAFVSDFARLKILYEHGGIYFDTDVEVLKRIPDKILKTGYFAKEQSSEIQTGLGFAVHPKNKVVKYMMDDYKKIHFIKKGVMDIEPCPKRNTRSLLKRGYIIDENNSFLEDVPIFEREYFCGYDIFNNHYIISDKTYTVHHYSGSWLSKNEQVKAKIRKKISKIIGKSNYEKLRLIKKKIIKK